MRTQASPVSKSVSGSHKSRLGSLQPSQMGRTLLVQWTTLVAILLQSKNGGLVSSQASPASSPQGSVPCIAPQRTDFPVEGDIPSQKAALEIFFAEA